MRPIDLKEWRKRVGLTQVNAAAALGIPYMTYRHWECGHQPSHALLPLATAQIEQRILVEKRGEFSYTRPSKEMAK